MPTLPVCIHFHRPGSPSSEVRQVPLIQRPSELPVSPPSPSVERGRGWVHVRHELILEVFWPTGGRSILTCGPEPPTREFGKPARVRETLTLMHMTCKLTKISFTCGWNGSANDLP